MGAAARRPGHIEQRRERGRETGAALWAMIATFGAYFCMYAFRKPYTAAEFAEFEFAGIQFKPLLLAAQVSGYALAKFIGIKFVSELPPARRAGWLLLLVAAAEAALVLFGLAPAPFSAVLLFLNGLTLGLVFGLVLGFVEGRRMTEVLAAALCASFILADGFAKSAGAWVLLQGVSAVWMPAATGLLFFPPFVLFVWMLSRIEPPTAADEAERSIRGNMSASDRRALFWRYASGLTALVAMYVCLTLMRSLRADFAPELWRELKCAQTPLLFSQSEMWVALGVLALNGSAALVRHNRLALNLALGTALTGLLVIFFALVLQRSGRVGGFGFMVLMGLGLYLPYVAVHTTIFERILAVTREPGTIGFLIYLADAFAYLAYALVMLVRQFVPIEHGILPQYVRLCWIATVASTVCVIYAWWYLQSAGPRQIEPALAAAGSALPSPQQAT